MGNASSHTYTGAAPPPAADARVILQHDLPKVIFVRQLANGKFIKSYQCRVDGVMVVVKVYIKRDPLEDLTSVEAALAKMAVALDTRSCPNVLLYQRWLQSSVRASQHRGAGTPAYLLRQHLLGTLSDRLSTRPFLTDIEKRWLVYLLLRAAAQCHARGVCHGDIKSENVLVTSGNWVLLTDFAPFKPTFLPDDHPADANYYFSSGEQGRCYLAPERFFSAHQAGESSAPAAASERAGKGGREGRSGATGRGGAEGPGGGRGGGLEGLEASEIHVRASPALSPSSSPKDGSSGVIDGGGVSSPGAGVVGDGDGGTLNEQRRPIVGGGGGAKGDAKRVAGAGSGTQGISGQGLLESMDVFSLGCVIAEIFLGGDPLLDLPGLLRYRISGDMEPRLKKLGAAGGPVVLRLVEHMLQRDASKRKTVQEYINRMEKPGMLFPPSFGSFLFPLLATMHAGEGAGDTDNTGIHAKDDKVEVPSGTDGGMLGESELRQGLPRRAVRSPDERLALVTGSYGKAMCELAGTPDPEGHALLQEALVGFELGRDGRRSRVPEANGGMNAGELGGGESGGDRERLDADGSRGRGAGAEGGAEGAAESDLAALMQRTRSLIARVESLAGGTPTPSSCNGNPGAETAAKPAVKTQQEKHADTAQRSKSTAVPASGSGRGGGGDHGWQAGAGQGLIIPVQVVCSCMRHLRYPRSRLLALNLLVAFGRCCDDEARLQRLVPYTMTMLEDSVPVVRATAVRCLQAILGMVTSFPPSDSNTFSLYIFPALQRLASDSSDLVRIAFAESLASLAETSRRFLETAYAMRRAAAATAASVSATAAATAVSASSTTAPTTTAVDQESADAAGPSRSLNGADDEASTDHPAEPNPDGGAERRGSGEVESTEVGAPALGIGSGGGGGGGGGAGGSSTPAPGAVLLEGSYDKELSSIRAQISRWFVVLASSGGSSGGGSSGGGGVSGDWTGAVGAARGVGGAAGDGGASAAAVVVKRALLADITRLCIFFGFENTLDSILPQLITFLNDRDWSLRAAFCDHIPAVCALAGEVATTRFILPCIENTLVDAREAVVARGLRCLASLAGLGLLPRYALPAQAKAAAPLLQHPGIGVRAGAMELCVRAGEALGPLDAQVFLHPVLRPHLRYALCGGVFDEATLLEALRPPVARAVFDAAVAEIVDARRGRVTGGGGGGGGGVDRGSGRSGGRGGGERLDEGQAYTPSDRDTEQQPGSSSAVPQRTSSGSSIQSQRSSSRDGTIGGGGTGAAEGPAVTTTMSYGGGGAAGARRSSPEEKDALALLKGYIETAAQHAANKLAGRHSSGSGLQQSQPGRHRPFTAPAALYLPESLSQAVYVPTQKITTLHPGAGAGAAAIAAAGWVGDRLVEEGEDLVELRLDSQVLALNPSLLQSITGMHTNPLDARRAMAIVEQTEADGGPDHPLAYANYYGYGGYNLTVTPNTAAALSTGGVPGTGDSNGLSTGGWDSARGVGGAGGADAWTLVRRAKALGVPPLPPNLGAVRAPNGAKYSHYLLHQADASRSGSSSASSGRGGEGSSAAGSGGTVGSSSSAAAAGAAQAQPHAGAQQYEMGTNSSSSRRLDWKPRQGVLVASLREHGGAVNRLALSQDQAFFVSASADGTCKVWELRGMDHTVSPQSRATYSRQGGRLLDLCMVDNSHSVASASSDGTVHVWRVELAASTSGLPYGGYSSANTIGTSAAGGGGVGGVVSSASVTGNQYGGSLHSAASNGSNISKKRYGGGTHSADPTLAAMSPMSPGNGTSMSGGGASGGGGGVGAGGSARSRSGSLLRVCGSSMIRSVSSDEGEVVSVHHFNTELGSPLVYGTRKGRVRSWDLRAREEPWALQAHPELGYLTAIALGTEKTWLVVGTSRGFVMLWDLRFQILARLWRHSSGGPVHKLATCSRLPPPDTALGPHVIVAAGTNEAAIWDLSRGGACKQCFRVVPPAEGPAPPQPRGRNHVSNVLPPGAEELPVLQEVSPPNHPNAPALSLGAQLSAVREFSEGATHAGGEPAIRALVGRISRSERDSYLITGGTDRCIRYWDFNAASRCYVVSGKESLAGRPSARRLQVPGPSSRPSTVVLFYDDWPAAPTAPSLRGDSLPMAQEKGLVAPQSSHDDAVLDVKVTELPIKMLLSGSRDGAVKIWR